MRGDKNVRRPGNWADYGLAALWCLGVLTTAGETGAMPYGLLDEGLVVLGEVADAAPGATTGPRPHGLHGE